MPECAILNQCTFYNTKCTGMNTIPERMAQFKKRFCLFDSNQCARFRVYKSVGAKKIPEDLYPDMYERASHIMRGMK